MAYKLYDQNNKEITYHDLQDKGQWCKTGEAKEKVFVGLYGAKLGIGLNPAKVTSP